MVRRVQRPADKEHLLKQLEKGKDDGIFSTEVEALIFAAALGASREESKPLGKALPGLVYELFSNKTDVDALFYMLGIARTGDLSLLKEGQTDERVRAFEEYANAGLEILQKEMKATGQTPRQVVVNLILRAKDAPKGEGQIDLEYIAKEYGLR